MILILNFFYEMYLSTNNHSQTRKWIIKLCKDIHILVSKPQVMVNVQAFRESRTNQWKPTLFSAYKEL